MHPSIAAFWQDSAGGSWLIDEVIDRLIDGCDVTIAVAWLWLGEWGMLSQALETSANP